MTLGKKTKKASIYRVVFLIITTAVLMLSLGLVNRFLQRPTNLLAESAPGAGLAEWETYDSGGTVKFETAGEPANPVAVTMSIPRVDQQAWVAIRKQVPNIEPLQTYNLALNYKLPHEGQSKAKIIVRVAQYGQANDLIKQDEISDPDPLITTLDESRQLTRQTLHHTFIAEDQTAAVEVSVALFSNEAAVVEVDQLMLEPEIHPVWLFTTLRIVLLILLISLGGYSVIYYARRRSFVVRHGPAIRRWGLIIAVNGLVFVVLAELTALGIYFFRNQSLFYVDRRPVELVGLTEQNGQSRAQLSGNLTSRRIHPFFGFVVQPGIDERFNNYGLISPYDYPYKKSDDDQFIVAIFGGSVAEIFSQAENRERFIENLKVNELYSDKEIVVLNFAAGAYKQPQQLMLLNYFLSIGQHLDMVINIDGFNEASMSYINYQDGVDISMPVSYIMLPLVNLSNQNTPSPQTVELLAAINRDRVQLNQVARVINRNRIASVSFMLEQYYGFLHDRYRQSLADLEAVKGDTFTSLIHINSAEDNLTEAKLFQSIAQNWAESSIIMHQVLKGRGIPYFHFLQPNQYYSKKSFSDEETRIAINPNQISRVGVEGVYPVLIEKFTLFEENKVNFYNGLEIFDNEAEIVYGDDCCHYNKLGNQILADFIADAILQGVAKADE